LIPDSLARKYQDDSTLHFAANLFIRGHRDNGIAALANADHVFAHIAVVVAR
jgi:hypothetical protein